MKTINATTKAAARFINAYRNSVNDCLSDCYDRYSFEKGRAEYLCREQMKKENGHGFRIMSFNSFGFTCGWMVDGVLRVETPSNSYRVA